MGQKSWLRHVLLHCYFKCHYYYKKKKTEKNPQKQREERKQKYNQTSALLVLSPLVRQLPQ